MALPAANGGQALRAGGAFVDGMSLTFRIGAGVNLLATVVTLAPFGRRRARRSEDAAAAGPGE